jgi:manganese oxidase
MNKTAPALKKIAPGYMPMGGSGMGVMGSMEMPLPDNTLPMMTGYGQFGPLEMGGMFTVVKVRPGLAANDYTDPGRYQHPEGTVAYEWTGPQLAKPHAGRRPTLTSRPPSSAQSTGANVESGPPVREDMTITSLRKHQRST